MASGAAIALLRLELEDADLRATEVLRDCRNDGSAVDNRRTDCDSRFARDHQHAVDLDLRASLGIQSLNRNRVARGDAVLFAACLNDRVHRVPLLYPLSGAFAPWWITMIVST